MSDKDERNKLVVLHSIPNHQSLMKVNRWLMYTVFFLMSVIIIAGFWLMPSPNTNNYHPVTAQTYVEEMNPVLSAEVKALKGQFVGLMSGSIESKLRTLEESVRLGAAPDALLTIEELRSDIKTLRAYSDTPTNKSSVPNEKLIKEMSELKRLVYLTLASCGLMFAAIAGIWIKNRHKLPYKEMMTRYLHHKD